MNDAKLQNIGLLCLRIAVGLNMVLFGAQKLLGVFGGLGFNGTLAMFHDKMGIPPWLGALAIFAEFFGGLGLLAGLFSRLAAFGVACAMAGAMIIQLRAGNLQANEGTFQSLGFPLALLGGAIAVLMCGPGKISLDGKFFRRGR